MKKALLFVGALGVFAFMQATPAHAAGEKSLGLLVYEATGVVIPRTTTSGVVGGNWITRNGTDDWAALFGMGTPTVTSSGDIDATVNSFSDSIGWKVANVAGYAANTRLVDYNTKSHVETVVGKNTLVGGTVASPVLLPTAGITSPFKLAITDGTGVGNSGARFFSSTLASNTSSTDYPLALHKKAAKVFKVENLLGTSTGAGSADVATTSVNNGYYIIGFEDTPTGNGDGGHADFQDLVFVLAPNTIPEPAFYQMSAMLLGGGLLALRLRRKKS